MRQSNPIRQVSQNKSIRGKKSTQSTLKEANRSKVRRDWDLKEKSAEKRCREQQRGRGKVAAKREGIR